MKVKKCVFPVAGLGTRFLPVTKEIAKEMLPLVNRPIISYGVEEALGSGCDRIIMITGRAKKSLEDYFDRSFELEELLKARGKNELYEMMIRIAQMADIMFIRQREPLGLGHAVLCAEPVCNNDFFGVALPDDVFVNDVPVLSQLINVHEKMGGSVIALEEVALVIYLSAAIHKLSAAAALSLFLIYSVLNGITCSVLLLIYTIQS